MRRTGFRLLGLFTVPLALAYGLALACAVRAGETSDPAALLLLLEEGDFDARKSVEKKLEDMGERARAALEKAAKSLSPELRQTALRLLARLSEAEWTVEVRGRDGKPIPDARVTWSLSPAEGMQTAMTDVAEAPEEHRTDAAGRLNTGKHAAGIYHYSLEFAEYSVAPDNTLGGSGALLLMPGTNLLRLTLQPRGTFKGVVQREDGTPLAEAMVLFLPDSGPIEKDVDLEQVYLDRLLDTGESALTDKSGAFESKPLDTGDYHLFIKHPDYALALHEHRTLKGGPCDAGTLKLTRRADANGILRFQLLNGNGQPLASRPVHIRLEPHLSAEALAKAVRTLRVRFNSGFFEEPASQHAMNVETNEQGVVELAALAAGTYDVVVTDEEGEEQTYFLPGLKAEPTPPERPGVKPTTMGGINGRLAGPDGKGLVGLQVYALNENSPVTHLMREDRAYCQGIAYSLDEFAPQGVSGEEGAFQLSGLTPGTYTLVVCAESTPVLIAPGQKVALGEMAQAPMLTVDRGNMGLLHASGKILLEDRTPAAGATVYLVDAQGSSSASSTGGEGEFSVSMSGEPPLWLGVTFSGHALETREIKGSQADLEIVLKKEPAGSLRVNVTAADGAPISGAQIHWELAGTSNTYGAAGRQGANAHGQALMRNLRRGKYRVQAQNVALGGMALAEVDVLSGQEARCDLKFPAAARLEGRVVCAGPAAEELVANTQLALWREDDEHGLASDFGEGSLLLTPQADGRFQAGPLRPGRYSLSLHGNGTALKTGAKLNLELKPGATAMQEVAIVRAASLRVDVWNTPARMVLAGAPGFWKKAFESGADTDMTDVFSSEYSNQSAASRLEGLPPGEYDVLWHSFPEVVAATSRSFEILRVIPGVRLTAEHARAPLELRVPSPEKPAAVNLRVELSLETAHVAQRFQFQDSLQVRVLLTGARERASFRFPLREILSQGQLRVVGEAPALPHIVHKVEGLSPGEYRCALTLEWPERVADARTEETRSEALDALPARVTLTKDQTLELNAALTIPNALLTRFESMLQANMIRLVRENMSYTQAEPQEGFQP